MAVRLRLVDDEIGLPDDPDDSDPIAYPRPSLGRYRRQPPWWGVLEDATLISMRLSFKTWRQIAEALPGRTRTAVTDRALVLRQLGHLQDGHVEREIRRRRGRATLNVQRDRAVMPAADPVPDVWYEDDPRALRREPIWRGPMLSGCHGTGASSAQQAVDLADH